MAALLALLIVLLGGLTPLIAAERRGKGAKDG
jgi:hypothetical protein